MSTLSVTILVWLVSLAAGMLGSLTGLGGGVVLVPLLTLVFDIDLRYAAGASLISVIATSSGAAVAYVKQGYSNIRVGMFLEIATTVGAIAGAHLASHLPTSTIAIVFGLVLLYSAWLSLCPKPQHAGGAPDPLASRLRLDGSMPGPEGPVRYHVRHVPAGFSLMFGAGILSGLLGIGSGAVKVLAMDNVMRLPFKASTTTSNFMIGVTAAASAGIYLHRGYVDPALVMPVMLGVLPGALVGSQLLGGARVGALRLLFGVVVVALAVEMIYNGWTGTL